MNKPSIPTSPSNILTLKGLTSKQKDGLIAGGLTLASVIAGAGFYQLFGRKVLSDDVNSSLNSAPNVATETIIESEASITEPEVGLNEIEALEPSFSFSFNSEAKISNSVSDDMDFDQAFSAARQDVGAGGFFNYKGDSYSTFYEEEWNGMSPENQDEYLMEVQDQAQLIQDESIAIDNVESNLVDSVVDDYQVVEEEEVTIEAISNDDTSLFGEDDFFSDINEEAGTESATEETTGEAISIEGDDFFSEINEEAGAESATEETTGEAISIEGDDFFSGINEEASTESATEETTGEAISIEGDDFFSEINEEAGTESATEETTEEAISIENDDFFSDIDSSVESADNVVVVKPIYGLDQDGDDVIDMIAIDANEDGLADVIALDENNDGDYESFMINEQGGDNLDVFIVDEGNDGIDPSDSRENIDNVVSMEDFIVLGDDEVEQINDLDEIESLIDRTDIIVEDDSSDDLENNDFDEIGL